MGNIVEVTDANFEAEVLKSPLLVVVDFWAEWCGPCRLLAPILEELSTELDGKVKITKLNVDTSPATPGQFGIQGIPTLIFFRDGKAVGQEVGVKGKEYLRSVMEGMVGTT